MGSARPLRIGIACYPTYGGSGILATELGIALAQEEEDHSPVIQFSAGAFKDFTRIASSNPVMWRDIFLMNREPVLKTLRNFITDMEACARAIEAGDGDTLEKLFSVSRSTRRKVIEKEHISQQPDESADALKDTLFRPYSQGD